MDLSIATRVGYQGGAGSAAGDVPVDHIYDTFGTDIAQGSVEGSLADPGPGGIETIEDPSSSVEVLTDKLLMPDGLSRVWYGAVNRQAGQIMLWTIDTMVQNVAGWDDNKSGNATSGHGVLVAGTDVRSYDNNQFDVVGTYASETQWASILRDAGAMLLVKRSGNWQLLDFTGSENAATLYPSVATNASGGAEVSKIRVPKALWLPAPSVSDGFGGEFGTPDGLGHPEGLTGGVGSGGSGGSWDEAVGAWAATGGQAHSTARVGGVAYLTISSGETDCLVACSVTRSGGTAGIVARYVDDDNHVQLRHTGTNIQLVKLVGGTATSLVDTSATYVEGAQIRLVIEGTKFRAFYNGSDYGGEQTISDGVLQTSPTVGLRTSNDSNLFDDFVAYARGTGGEYARLDDF